MQDATAWLADLADALRHASTADEATRLVDEARAGISRDGGDEPRADSADAVLRLAMDGIAARADAAHARLRLDTNERIAELGSYDWDVGSDTNTWSDQLYRIYGYEPGAFNASYDKFISMIHPDDRERIKAIHAEAFETGEPFEMEERIVRPDGEERLLWSNGVVITDDDGQPVRFVGTCRDITEARSNEQAHEQALREASEHRQRIHEAGLARRQSLELNDNVVQGLVTANWLLEDGDVEAAAKVVRRTLDAARRMMDDLYVAGQMATEDDLVRSHAAPSSDFDHTATAGDGTGVRIVIADDSEDVRFLLRLRFERNGEFVVVAEADNGRDAVDLVAQHRPDVIVLDLAMPHMDGLQAAAEIREASPDTHIVILSGYGEDAMQERALEAGADDYVTKAADFENVVTAVRARLAA
jgi:PAS domain S-box-containing protein